jgi:hypothetical protein
MAAQRARQVGHGNTGDHTSDFPVTTVKRVRSQSDRLSGLSDGFLPTVLQAYG